MALPPLLAGTCIALADRSPECQIGLLPDSFESSK